MLIRLRQQTPSHKASPRILPESADASRLSVELMNARRFQTIVVFGCLVVASTSFPARTRGAEFAVPPPPPTPTSIEPSVAEQPPPSSTATIHADIDRLVQAATPEFASLAASLSSDEEFVRRVYLDLAGTIPTAEQARAFIADPLPEKRTSLIDALLASPQHARRMQYVLDEMLMERRGGTDVPNAEWETWLRESFRNNKPWDQLVTEILSADGADEKLRPAAKFYLDRKFDIDLVTRDIGRVFLGVDLECAQCHDHPSIDDYLQRHYYGLSAFLKRSYLFTDSKSKKKMLGEKAEGDVKFTSVFTAEEGQTDPRVMNLPGIPDPKPATELYVAKPAGKVRGIPTYSRRMQFAKAMITDDNVDFRTNIVNRLWALLMGRGLVEPLDIRHSANAPSHPKVLQLLEDEFLVHKYNIRWLVRELALTKTYQRSSEAPPDSDQATKAADAFARGLLKPLSPEQLGWSSVVATEFTTVTMKAQEAVLQKAEPEAAAAKQLDPLWREETLHKALKSELDLVVTRFAGQGGQKTSFEATADQALFLINGPSVEKWLKPQNGVLTNRLQKLDSSTELAEELYVAVLSRRPTDNETANVKNYLESVSDRPTAIREMTWALLSSAEFRFNH